MQPGCRGIKENQAQIVPCSQHVVFANKRAKDLSDSAAKCKACRHFDQFCRPIFIGSRYPHLPCADHLKAGDLRCAVADAKSCQHRTAFTQAGSPGAGRELPSANPVHCRKQSLAIFQWHRTSPKGCRKPLRYCDFGKMTHAGWISRQKKHYLQFSTSEDLTHLARIGRTFHLQTTRENNDF